MPPVTAAVNELAEELGYITVDETWSVAERAPDLRRSSKRPRPARWSGRLAGDTRQMPRVFVVLGDMLQKGLFRVSDRFVRRWGRSRRSRS